MLIVEHLTKVYRNGVRANDDISINVGAGEVVALLGHNGAGKTTLINQAAGLAAPTNGTIRLDNCDPVAEPARARKTVSVMPQVHAPLSGITPRQAIETLARIRGASRSEARQQTNQLMNTLDIESWADSPGERLSGGVRRLTAFCMTAANAGKVVMLDEPTNDVDPVRRRLLWQVIRTLADDGRAVLIVTHNVLEAERGSDRVIILDAGRVLAEGTPTQLRSGAAGEMRLELVGNRVDEVELDPRLPLRGDMARFPGRLVLPISDADVDVGINWARKLCADGSVEEFALSPVSLEDVYVNLVGGDAQGDADRTSDYMSEGALEGGRGSLDS